MATTATGAAKAGSYRITFTRIGRHRPPDLIVDTVDELAAADRELGAKAHQSSTIALDPSVEAALIEIAVRRFAVQGKYLSSREFDVRATLHPDGTGAVVIDGGRFGNGTITRT